LFLQKAVIITPNNRLKFCGQNKKLLRECKVTPKKVAEKFAHYRFNLYLCLDNQGTRLKLGRYTLIIINMK
jgi:hypothetical protein